MRIRRYSNIVIFILLSILVLAYFIYPPRQQTSWSSTTPIEQLVIREAGSLNRSLPYHQYKQKEDSIRRQISDAYFKSSSHHEIAIFDIGVAIPKSKSQQHYLTIDAYHLKGGDMAYSLNEKNYLEYTVWGPEKDGVRSGETKTIETSVKLNQKKNGEYHVAYFPISRNNAMVLKITIIVLMVIFGVVTFYALFYLPLRFLFLVAKGKPFDDESIGILHAIAWFLLATGILSAVLKILFHLIFKSELPPQVHFNYYDAIMSGWGFLVAGLGTLLFAKAFLRAAQLQEEQALTI